MYKLKHHEWRFEWNVLSSRQVIQIANGFDIMKWICENMKFIYFIKNFYTSHCLSGLNKYRDAYASVFILF